MEHPGHERNMDLLMDISVPVQISFGSVSMQLNDLLALKAGSLVELNREIDGNVDVIVNNRVIARGEVVDFEGEYGVRIHSLETAGTLSRNVEKNIAVKEGN